MTFKIANCERLFVTLYFKRKEQKSKVMRKYGSPAKTCGKPIAINVFVLRFNKQKSVQNGTI